MSHYVLSKTQSKKQKPLLDTVLDATESLWESVQRRIADAGDQARQKKFPNAARHY